MKNIFDIYSDTFDIGWNGNFIVPKDVLKKFSQIEKVNLRKICSGDPKRAKQRLSKTLSSAVPMKIAGFNSRMDNIDTVQNAQLLDEFILDFSRITTSYMSQGKSDDGEIALPSSSSQSEKPPLWAGQFLTLSDAKILSILLYQV